MGLDKWVGKKKREPTAMDVIDSREYGVFRKFIIERNMFYEPTEEEWRFNEMLIPGIKKVEDLVDDLIEFSKKWGRTTRDKRVYNKLKEIIEEGIDIRLLTEEEFKERLNAV